VTRVQISQEARGLWGERIHAVVPEAEFVGRDAETGWMPEAITRDDRGFVCTGEAAARSGRWPMDRDPYLLETTVPGIFACGDVRSSPVKRVAAAVGEGSMAIAFVHQYLAHAGSAPAG